jgi:S-adenosylmethionine:tRNA ribosyltransferase-isomerase
MRVTGTLDFDLPADLEAREPPEGRGLPRDGVRLLVSYRDKDGIVDARFTDLPALLQPGDLVVVNDSATLPASLPAQGPQGQALRLHLSTHLPADLWVVEPRWTEAAAPGGSPGAPGGPPAGAPPGRDGEPFRLSLPGGGTARLLTPFRDSPRLWVARLDLPAPYLDYLTRWGSPIRYAYVPGEWPLAMYQTVFATHPGSAEMPSAGRAFSRAVLADLERRGIQVVRLTLHTGVASAERDEPPYEEELAVPWETAQAVNDARSDGRRVVATGTTVVRALESATDDAGRVIPLKGWTDLVITPERGVRVVDGLLTGFHEPRASHLAMLEAIAGRAHLRRAYRAALDGRYLWHEFGDLHLIL